MADFNGKLVMEVNYEELYGKLEKGEYRLVKEVDGKEIYVEFSI